MMTTFGEEVDKRILLKKEVKVVTIDDKTTIGIKLKRTLVVELEIAETLADTNLPLPVDMLPLSIDDGTVT